MKEQNLLEMILKGESWDELIYNIVSYEGLDPWDIDIIKLTDSFLKYIEKMKTLDFRVPAKVVLVAAILLKLKSNILSPMRVEGTEYYPVDMKALDEYEQIRLELESMELKPPMERRVKRKVTIDELIDALRKAMKVKQKKERIRRKLGKRIRAEIGEEVDIELRIKNMMSDIDVLLGKLKADKIMFSKIVDKWERNEIVRCFMPLLYLSSRGKVSAEQKEFFKEILISKKW